MENAYKSDEELVSTFVVRTCRLRTKSVPNLSDYLHDLVASNKYPPTDYSFLCGSHAEFYIQPLMSCIDDTDYIFAKADELAFSGDFPVLPSDIIGLADKIECYQIQPHHMFPGFVRLQLWGEMKYNWKCKRYEFNHDELSSVYMLIDMDQTSDAYNPSLIDRDAEPSITSGPAVKKRRRRRSGCCDLSDVVRSVWCPQWPKEAQDWPKRLRRNGWPTIDSISQVVQNGCHVVYVQHRSCRDDKYQWRLSFSIAELISIQSWSQNQQIVYHLLRFLVKREIIQKDCPKEDEVLCPYHLKTLMLWTCEEMPPEWWDSSPVIAICCELLQKLLEWIKRRHCPNYFIPEANLFHHPSNSRILDETKRRLYGFCNSDILCKWFVKNYILPGIQPHLKIESAMDVTANNFFDYILPLLEFWKMSELKSLDFFFIDTMRVTYEKGRAVIKNGLNSGLRQSIYPSYIPSCLELKTHRDVIGIPTLRNIRCFRYCQNLLYILHTAYGLGCEEISWDSSVFVEFIKALSMQRKYVGSRNHNFPKAYTEPSRQPFLDAQDLMENLTGTNNRSEFQLLSLMSRQLLRRTLESNCSKSNGMLPAALTYLAALHFATSEYQEAIRLCLEVLLDQPSHMNKETLNAGCLLFIDEIATIVGLCVLYKRLIGEEELRYIGKRLYLDLRLSPSVFAHCIAMLSAERLSEHFDIYRKLPDSAFPMDTYLKALMKPIGIVSMLPTIHFTVTRQGVSGIPDALAEPEASSLNPKKVVEAVIDALSGYAGEHMASFYWVISNDYGIHCNTVECYRALCLYKCRNYDEVLHLCEQILHEPELQSNLKELALANVLLIPPFDSFFDRDVQSLLGFHTLSYYLSPQNEDISKVEFIAESTFQHWFARNVYCNRCEFFACLRTRYSIKCNYFLGRHFLARYLKVRCCVDCNLPYKEALTEFSVTKTKFPFELIIRRFLLHKLCIIKTV